MFNFIRIDNQNVVQEIIPEFSEDFPDIPIGRRYPPEFVSALIVVDSSEEVKPLYIYCTDSQIFMHPTLYERSKRLKNTDWAVGNDTPLTPECEEDFRKYRQALRDMSTIVGFPDFPTWPEKPIEITK